MSIVFISLAVVALALAGIAGQMAWAAEPAPQQFDLNACYSNCRCATDMKYLCLQCRVRCDRSYWKDWDKGIDTTPEFGDSGFPGLR